MEIFICPYCHHDLQFPDRSEFTLLETKSGDEIVLSVSTELDLSVSQPCRKLCETDKTLSELVVETDKKIVCPNCGLRYKMENGLYYFFDELAEHWQIHYEAVRKLGHAREKGSPLTCQFPAIIGYPYTDNLKNGDLAQRAKAYFLNISFALLSPSWQTDEEGYLVEMGAFNGWAAYHFARHLKVIAIDLAEPALCCIDANYGKGITKVVCDGTKTPLRDESVAVVFMYATFHHFHNKHQALDELYRILKPGGYLLAVGEIWSPDNAIPDPEQEAKGEWGYTYAEMIEMFQQSKFKNITRIAVNYFDQMEWQSLEGIISDKVEEQKDCPGDNGIIYARKEL